MKIMHLITGLKVGGAETVLYNLLAYSDRSKDDHYVVYFYKGTNVAKIAALGVPTYHVKGLFSAYDPVGLVKLLWRVYRFKPDVIHSSLWSATILAQIISLVFKTKVVSSLHCKADFLGTFRNAINRITFKWSDRFIAVSPSVKESFEKKVLPAQRTSPPIDIIFNSVDIEKLHELSRISPLKREHIQATPYDFIFGAVGRLVPVKGFEALITAFSVFCSDAQSAKLCIVGDGPDRQKLERLARTLNIHQKIAFVGEVSNVASVYPLFDCFILTSHSEGLSMALLEACAFNLPVITSGHNRKHDIIEHGINGFIVDPFDFAGIAEAMLQIYRYATIREVMRNQNSLLAKKHFSVKRMVASYDKIFHSFEKIDTPQ